MSKIRSVIMCSSNNVVTYKASGDPISKNFTGYEEVGMHCGTETQAKDFLRSHPGYKLYKITIHPSKIFDYDGDLDYWTPSNVLHHVIRPLIKNIDDYRQLFNEYRKSDDKNKFVRDLFLSNGYDCIKYINHTEGQSQGPKPSYLILDPSIIIKSEEINDH